MAEPLRPTLSDALTARVIDLIRSEGLRPGDRLPSAQALAQRFAVATPTVREVLRRLQATGAVELRHGSGVYVGGDLNRVVLPNPVARGLPADRLLQLLDARLLIEPELARRAAAIRGDDDLERLAALLDKAEGCLDLGDDAALHDANMAFHRAVAAAAGNSVLSEVVDSLLTVHSQEQREILRIYDDRRRDHNEHLTILAAIQEGNPQRAQMRMRRHLEGIKRVIEQRLGPPRSGTAPPAALAGPSPP